MNDKLNVLIIVTNRYRRPVPVIPVGACLVADASERAGYDVRVLDMMFEQDPHHALMAGLDAAKPDVIGLSVRNIDNNDMQHPVAFVREVKSMVALIRRKTRATIILGGSAVSVMPGELLRYTGADWAVLGDGDIVFPELIEAVSNRRLPDDVPGVAWIENDQIRKNTGYVSRFTRGCHVPDYSRWINIPSYLSRLSTVPVQTKLGCHFKCVYCTYRKIEGTGYRLCDPGSVADAVGRLVSVGLRDIEFVDNVFNAPYEHALEICECIARLRYKARLQSLELNPLFIDDTLLTAMEHAGFAGIGVTVESASDTVLNRLQKGFTAENVYSTARVIKEGTLPCLWIFMLGGPGETEATVDETFHFAKHFIRPGDVAFFNVGVRIYPGTKLEEIAREEGVLTLPPHEMLEPVFYISPELHQEWLLKRLHQELNTHMNYISSSSLGLSILPIMNRLGYRLGIRSPLWRYTRYLRNGLRCLGMDV